ncbi:MAG: type IV pili methyl-accepting chemotaxis transducer N-terminal domain-containing protein [Piscinibacter sp.]|uniref:type IV pili methyl-accepting chemotaxis transducer N-terminal domain-containing protein n=1 Tax=Piscinibacter sp. TaxID=1903157 RepID=UPI002C0AD0C6|nr:type IV pili methyl-accepting chemotaxis transducer N-terminal domain-containing protein [Piscinibacter sp.]
MLNSVLLITTPDAPALATDLATLGVRVAACAGVDTLLREALRADVQAVVAWDPYPALGLLPALAALHEHHPLPVLLFTSDAEVETLAEALRCGVQAYVVNGYAPARLRPLLQLAEARFERENALRNAHDELAHRFEERKLVDRAKGILMRSLQIPEDEAFRLLRRASMQDQQRVGMVSRRVIQAAHDTEAVNRAGQLRMLSQRIVKLHALRQAGIASVSAHSLLNASVAQVTANLDHLARELSKLTFGDLLAAATNRWRALSALLDRDGDAAALGPIDAAAEELLVAAEALTAALAAASPLPTLGVINRAGRQRMLSQRLAKQALLGTLAEGEAGRRAAMDAVAGIQEFEAALVELERSPLSTPDIRAGLADAVTIWRRLTAALRDARDAAARTVIATDSEALLQAFERLTELYGRGAQQLLESA